MNNRQKLKFALIFFLSPLFLSVVSAETPPDYYSPENVRKFADFLYEQGDYLRAIGEYQRYLFYRPKKARRFIIELQSVIASVVRRIKQSKVLKHFYKNTQKVNIQAKSTTRLERPIF